MMENMIARNLMTHAGFLSAACFLVLLLTCPYAHASPYTIEVSKSSQTLVVKDGPQVIKRFRIASGKGGSGTKRQWGDNKTPIGTYKIIEFRENSRFHYFMQINYPNTVDAWYGYKNNLINGEEFREIVKAVTSNMVPPQDTSLGGYIGLHGLGEITEQKLSIHSQHDWTEGCIALLNEEISELREYVTIGTTILIRE